MVDLPDPGIPLTSMKRVRFTGPFLASPFLPDGTPTGGRTALSGGGTSDGVGKKRMDGETVADGDHRHPHRCTSAPVPQ